MARPKGTNGGPSQTKMVMTALQELGEDAKPQAIQDYIKSKYGKELSKTIISNYKSNMKRKGVIGAAGPAETETAAPGAGRGRPQGTGNGIQVEDLEAVRGLVSRLGATQLRRVVDALA